MKEEPSPTRRRLAVWVGALFLLLLPLVTVQASESATAAVKPLWTAALPSASCPWSAQDINCHHASPAIADITGDGRLEIIVATNKGHVLAYRYDGQLLWDRDVAPAFGMGRASSASLLRRRWLISMRTAVWKSWSAWVLFMAPFAHRAA